MNDYQIASIIDHNTPDAGFLPRLAADPRLSALGVSPVVVRMGAPLSDHSARSASIC